jgi:hypothetical protein
MSICDIPIWDQFNGIRALPNQQSQFTIQNLQRNVIIPSRRFDIVEKCCLRLNSPQFHGPSVTFATPRFLENHITVLLNKTYTFMDVSIEFWRTIPGDPFSLNMPSFITSSFHDIYVVVINIRYTAPKILHVLQIGFRVLANAAEKDAEVYVEISHIAGNRAPDKMFVHDEG